MPLTFNQSPLYSQTIAWWTGWPIQRQLWRYRDNWDPGEEVDLTSPLGPPNRGLRIRIKETAAGSPLFEWAEPSADFPLTITHAKRGLVTLQFPDEVWEKLIDQPIYLLEIVAYGVVYSFELATTPITQGYQILDGVKYYGSPRQILEVLGPIPGAIKMTGKNLSGNWLKDDRGYWTKTISPDTPLHGLWINDRFAERVEYKELATHYRSWARVGETVYYSGDENLNSLETYVETGFSIYVLRCLQEATAEIERKTGRRFNRHRIFREAHRGLHRQRQLFPGQYPIEIDAYFRLDSFSNGGRFYQRYTQSDFRSGRGGFSDERLLHAEDKTGIITISRNLFDWFDWGARAVDYYVGEFAFMPVGENNIELTYTGGVFPIPHDVDEAAANLAAIRQGTYWQQLLSQGMSGMSIGCVKMNFSEMISRWFPSWQQSADSIIESHMNVHVTEL